MNMQSLLQVNLFLQITPGRLTSILAGFVGLISVIIGWLALVRSANRVGSRRLSTIALLMGMIGVIISVLHLASTTGGFGTGKGRAGAIVAIVIGLIGVILGWLALNRFRRIATRVNTKAATSMKERI
jgi:hypothetical protein